ncbi:hypothetical protein VCR26J2_380109 [Vibrio coralliirubri]|nr:hypothetical protein VCR26J2_380109 [Vibrio coralliirubri]
MVTQGMSIIQAGCAEATFDLFTTFEGMLKARGGLKAKVQGTLYQE